MGSAPAGDTPRVTLGELYRGFFHAGARGVGGVLPWARRMLVEERRWLTAEEFTGPNTVNMSIVVGARFHGVRGAVIALLRWPFVPVLLTLAPLSVLAAWFRRA